MMLINITLEISHDLGYIYLNSFTDKFERVYSWQNRIRRYHLKELDNFYLQLNKLNWSDYSYHEAKLNGDYSEEYMYDPDHSGYLYGVSVVLAVKRSKVLKGIINIIKFELDGDAYYADNLDKIGKIFNDQHYIYHYNKGLYLIISLNDCQGSELPVVSFPNESKTIKINCISRLKAIIFPVDSHYEIDNFTNIVVNVG